ncbi:MAG: hypothetical protein FJW23_05020 [Acidimicrobiia bacterium]|nr:hypothetical protein [Acidimicrobiia bacterium]
MIEPGSRAAGFAMAALLVAIAIMSIAASAAMPVWSQMARREKEAELIFRGEQYGRAIGLFQRKAGPGALPPSIDVLVDGKFLRKKYQDPITGGNFQILTAAQAAGALQPGMPGGGGSVTPGMPGSGQPDARLAAERRELEQRTGPGPGGLGSRLYTLNPGGAPAQNLPGRPGSVGGTATAGGGGIIGVTSTSTEESIRLYEGYSHYNEWVFLFVAQGPAGAPGQGQPGAPVTGELGAIGARPPGFPGQGGTPGTPGRPGGGLNTPFPFPGGGSFPGGPGTLPSPEIRQDR